MGEASFGKYRLIAELGHGGMADVFLAVQAGPVGSGFQKLSVIKRLRQNLIEEPEFVEMLIEEARIAARLNHPNVVQTNEVGQVDQQYFIAMEYLDGQPLHRVQHRTAQRLKAGKPSPVGQGQQMLIVMDALAGLHHAHELADYDGSPLHIVHRDVTPQNIFVTYEGQVKVVDFGIAKAAGRASETRQGVVKGKIRYMAPEQALGQPVDRRADVFSLGIMLWEVATGLRLWKNSDDLEIVRQLIEGAYPSSPRSVEPSVSEALDRICQRALAHNRDDRYASCDEFRLDLEQTLADRGELVDARRKLGPAICELFQDKRAEIKAVIEQQLGALAARGSGDFSLSRMAESTPSGMAVSKIEAPGTSATFDAVELTPVPSRKAAGLRWVGIAAATLAFAGAVGIAISRATPPRASASEVQAPATSDISLRLRVTPESARVSIDDGPPRAAPFDLRVPKDAREHTLRFEADGHEPRRETVRFDEDRSVSVNLAPVKTAPSSEALTLPVVAHGQPTIAKAAVRGNGPRPVSPLVGQVPEPRVDPEPPAPKVEPPVPSPPKETAPNGRKRTLDTRDPWGTAEPR